MFVELKEKMGQFTCSLCCLRTPDLEAPEQRAVTPWTRCLQLKEGFRNVTDTRKTKGKYQMPKEKLYFF